MSQVLASRVVNIRETTNKNRGGYKVGGQWNPRQEIHFHIRIGIRDFLHDPDEFLDIVVHGVSEMHERILVELVTQVCDSAHVYVARTDFP